MQMTISLSKKTIAIVVIALVIAALAILSPVLLNSSSQKQGKENTAAVSKNSETDKQANSASAIAENTAEEDSGSQTSMDEANSSTAAAPRGNTQNQSAPDNDIPADGAGPSAGMGDNSQANNAGTTNIPTVAPDNDIKAE